MDALLLSFGVIFVAELGDKSQLMALAFASRHRPVPVLLGITVAAAAVHGMSVLAGVFLGAALPTDIISIAAGVAFLAFGLWTLRSHEPGREEAAQVDRSSRFTVAVVGGAFFLAELGDKTMLATITLATTGEALGVWAGATLGMVAADALAIVVGSQLGDRLPPRVIRLGAAAMFFLVGAVLVAAGIRG